MAMNQSALVAKDESEDQDKCGSSAPGNSQISGATTKPSDTSTTDQNNVSQEELTLSIVEAGDTNPEPLNSQPSKADGQASPTSADIMRDGAAASDETGEDKEAQVDEAKKGSRGSIAETSLRLAKNPEIWRTSRALVLALVILAMTTLPALYISLTAANYVVAADSFDSPGRLTHFIFAYALIKSDLFNLFTIAALPTLTAYFGSSDSKYREGFFPWMLFTYFVLLFVSTFVPQVVADAAYSNHQDWSNKVTAIAGTTESIQNYLTNVRNSAIGGIAVLTGIKLAS